MTPTRTITEAEESVQPSKLDAGKLPAERFLRYIPTYRFAAELKALGYDVGPEYDQAETLLAALADGTRPFDQGNLLDLDPATMRRNVLLTVLEDIAVRHGAGDVVNSVSNRMDDELTVAIIPRLDAIVTAMRTDFDAALATITAAHEAKLTPDTTMEEVVANGTQNQLEAYRTIGPAAATLNRLADLRIRMTNTCGYGPIAWPIAGLVQATHPGQGLEGAADLYTGTTETAYLNVGNASVAPIPRTVQRRRLGGPWLALVAAGYTVHLNTAAEAQAVVDTATASSHGDQG